MPPVAARRLGDACGAVELSRADGDLGALAGQQAGDALADGPGGAEHGRPEPLERAAQPLDGREHGGGGRGVGAVGVEQDGDAERAEEGLR